MHGDAQEAGVSAHHSTYKKTKLFVDIVTCTAEFPIHRGQRGVVGAGGMGNGAADSAFRQAMAFGRRVSGG